MQVLRWPQHRFGALDIRIGFPWRKIRHLYLHRVRTLALTGPTIANFVPYNDTHKETNRHAADDNHDSNNNGGSICGWRICYCLWIMNHRNIQRHSEVDRSSNLDLKSTSCWGRGVRDVVNGDHSLQHASHCVAKIYHMLGVQRLEGCFRVTNQANVDRELVFDFRNFFESKNCFS